MRRSVLVAICLVLRVRGATFVAVTRVAVLVVRGLLVVDGRGFRVVAWADLVGAGVRGQLVGVLGVDWRMLASEEAEEAAARSVARSVIIGRAWSETLLLTSVTYQHKLDKDRDDEEDAARMISMTSAPEKHGEGSSHGYDRDGQAGRLHLAGRPVAWQLGEAVLVAGGSVLGISSAEGRAHGSGTGAGATLIGSSNVDEAADESDIQDHGDEGGEGVAGQATEEQQAEKRVQHADARYTLDGAHPCRDGDVVVAQSGQEVAVDAEDEGAAAELDTPDEPLQELEGEARSGTHVGGAACRRLRRCLPQVWWVRAVARDRQVLLVVVEVTWV